MDASLRRVVLAAIAAGVAAGFALAVYHSAVTEPVLQRAIDFESQLARKHQSSGDDLVSRSAQHVGLFVGFNAYGLAWAMISASVYFPLQSWWHRMGAIRRVFLLSILMYWSVALLPFLKYPADPPGVGESATLQQRQELYFGFLALSGLAAALSVAFARSLGGRLLPYGLDRVRVFLPLGVGAVLAAALYIIMPANSDASPLPRDLLFDFRWRSLVGLTLFWGMFAVGFATLLQRCHRVVADATRDRHAGGDANEWEAA